MQAVKTWNTPGEQLLRPKSRDDDELEWIDVDWTDDQGFLLGYACGLCHGEEPAELREAQNSF